MPLLVTRTSTCRSSGSGIGRVVDQLEHLGPAPLHDPDRAHAARDLVHPRDACRRRHDAHRGRFHRLRRRRDPAGQPRPPARRRRRPLLARLVPARRDARSSGRSATTSASAEYAILHARGVQHDDVEHIPGGKTFFWAGRYHRDINQRDTLQTDLNVFEDFRPKLSQAARAAEVVFLGQHPARAAARGPRAVRRRALRGDGLDEPVDRHRARGSCVKTIATVDCLVLNDAELKQLTDEPNLIRAAHAALDLGPRVGDRQAGRVRLGADHARRLTSG